MKKTIDTFIIPNTMYLPLLIVELSFFQDYEISFDGGRNEDLDSITIALQV